jgi:hypothetical protein
LRADVFVIEDLKSRAGIFLNDEQIESPIGLVDGDRVRICDVVFRFSSGDAEDSIEDTEDYEESSTQLAASAEAELSPLIEITQSLGRAPSLDEVLAKVLDSLFRVFVQADRGFIGLLDEDGQLIPRWTKLRNDQMDTIRISRAITNQVIETKEAILSSDVANDERFEMSQSFARPHREKRAKGPGPFNATNSGPWRVWRLVAAQILLALSALPLPRFSFFVYSVVLPGLNGRMPKRCRVCQVKLA